MNFFRYEILLTVRRRRVPLKLNDIPSYNFLEKFFQFFWPDEDKYPYWLLCFIRLPRDLKRWKETNECHKYHKEESFIYPTDDSYRRHRMNNATSPVICSRCGTIHYVDLDGVSHRFDRSPWVKFWKVLFPPKEKGEIDG